MSTVNDKKAEIDLLRSFFNSDELTFENPSLIEEFDSLTSQNLPLEDRDVLMTLKIGFPELLVAVVLTINLPIGYPHIPPSIILRVKQSENVINEKALSSAFNEWLSEAITNGEPVICSVVDWIRSALDENNWDPYLGRDAFKIPQPPQPPPPPLTSRREPSPTKSDTQCAKPRKSSKKAVRNTEVCYWIFSHHIRNPKKRKVIVDWARELNLTGCCLPGKPGVVVVEGRDDNVEEYWQRIRVLTWKRIQVKDREEITRRRFSDGFFEIGGTLAEKIGYMRAHGVGQERIAAHFGFKAE